MFVEIIESDGDPVLWDWEELRARMRMAMVGLDLCLSEREIERQLRRSIAHGITRADLRATIILNAKTLLERDADFARFAGRDRKSTRLNSSHVAISYAVFC